MAPWSAVLVRRRLISFTTNDWWPGSRIPPLQTKLIGLAGRMVVAPLTEIRLPTALPPSIQASPPFWTTRSKWQALRVPLLRKPMAPAVVMTGYGITAGLPELTERTPRLTRESTKNGVAAAAPVRRVPLTSM